jgi:hypothetical protein
MKYKTVFTFVKGKEAIKEEEGFTDSAKTMFCFVLWHWGLTRDCGHARQQGLYR